MRNFEAFVFDMNKNPKKFLIKLTQSEWWSRVKWPLRLSLFAVAYLATAEVGYRLSLKSLTEVVTFWPASGLYLVVLLQTPQRRWPGFVAAALAANLVADFFLQDKSLLISLGFATANTLEALLGAWLCQKILDKPYRLDHLGTVLVFALVNTLVSTVLSATLGALTLTFVSDTSFASVWLGWWGAHVVGIAITTPLLLTLGGHVRASMWPLNALRWLEGGVMLIGLVVVTGFIFVAGNPVLGVPFFVMPFLLWAALRLGMGGTALAVLTLALFALLATIYEQDPFIRIDLTPPQQAVLIQGFIGICALCFLALAAVTAERLQAVTALRDANLDLEQRVRQRTQELGQANRILQKNEQQLRKTLDSLFAFVGVLTPTGVLLEANRAPLEAAGVDLDDVRGNYFWDCYWWNYAPEAQQQVRSAVNRAGQGESSRFDIAVRMADNSKIIIDFMLAPLRDEEGKITHLIPSGIDISQRKRVEQALKAAQAAAETANQAKSQFLANMSHEIRSPMTAILGYADILAAHLNDPDNLVCINTIQRNGQHLLELINDILDLSKIEAERLEIKPERFAPVQLIADVHSLMAMRAQEKGLPLEIVYASPLPETITSDIRRLKQILINLLSNAIKFTKQGSVTLRVDMLDDTVAPKLRFAVIDTGIGISKAQQSKLFQPFSQLDSAFTREHGGTGLGLAISQHLAKLLGGEITVKSHWRKGSTFTLTVATGSLEGVARSIPQPNKEEETVTLGGVSGLLQGHILVVDDRHDIRYLAQRYLEEAGATVTTAAGGKAALAAVMTADQAGQSFSTVVLDMQMPEMDGFAVVRKLRTQGFAAPIIALTAHAMLGDREKCLAAGCNGYLSKPVDRQQLITAVANLTQPHSPSSADTPTATTQSVPSSHIKVLIVDDNQDAANALAGMLTLLEYPVTTVYDGRSALATARSECPAVIILDINLPDMSGYEVCQQLKQEPTLQQTIFIALSGQDDAVAESLQAGFDYHQLKPASINDIVALFPG
jgi:PAS domain S-box-containing protein